MTRTVDELMPRSHEELDFPTVMASTVHDLKNSVGMLIDSMRDTANELAPREPNLIAHFSNLQYEAMRINNDLVQLLAVYKSDRGVFSLDISHHRVQDVLDECVLLYAPLLEHRRIAVETDCPDDLYWPFDAALVGGVINNVLNNAIRYTKDALLLKAAETQCGLVIQLEDNGPGYPDRLLAGDAISGAAIDFAGGGTGLGLYFSALVARRHESKGACGRVVIDNNGSLTGGRFSLFLP